MIADAAPRVRAPWARLLAVFAAHALVLGRGLPRQLGIGGALGAATALLFFFGVAVPYFFHYGGRP